MEIMLTVELEGDELGDVELFVNDVEELHFMMSFGNLMKV